MNKLEVVAEVLSWAIHQKRIGIMGHPATVALIAACVFYALGAERPSPKRLGEVFESVENLWRARVPS